MLSRWKGPTARQLHR